MRTASILIKPASAGCNMNCDYCFYKCLSSNREEYSKGFMTDTVLEQLVHQAVEYADEYLAFAFQGGEPTLAGVDFFRRVVSLQRKYNKKNLTIENTIQTNGLLLDEDWAQFLAENNFLVGLSLDGPRKIHDKHRLDMNGKGTFDRVIQAVRLLEKYQVPYNILSVITNESVQKASYLYKFYKRNHFPFVQLIPCMDENSRNTSGDKEPVNQYAVEPVQYGKFLSQLFDLWYADYMRDDWFDIRMFSNLIQMAAGYPAEQCGMNGCCHCYFVVEGDGSVYPCDFYCLDEWKLGTVQDSFLGMLESSRAKSFVEASRYIAPKCQTCSYFSLCRGGCRRLREPFSDGRPGLNCLCEAYQVFFRHTRERIEEISTIV